MGRLGDVPPEPPESRLRPLEQVQTHAVVAVDWMTVRRRVCVGVGALLMLVMGCSTSPEDEAARSFLSGEGRPLIAFHELTAPLADLDPVDHNSWPEVCVDVVLLDLDINNVPTTAELLELHRRMPEGPVKKLMEEEILAKSLLFGLCIEPERELLKSLVEQRIPELHEAVSDFAERYNLHR